MKNLELKHLAPYLPYGLTFYWESLDGSDKKHPWVLKPENIAFAIDMQNKPILRPLSDLTKEIEVNGEKFVPIDIIRKEDKDWFCIEGDEYILREDIGGGGWIGYITIERIPYWIIQQLFEWHFDVFGLIYKGLAIDINKLKK